MFYEKLEKAKETIFLKKKNGKNLFENLFRVGYLI